jgi:hypothetical protein
MKQILAAAVVLALAHAIAAPALWGQRAARPGQKGGAAAQSRVAAELTLAGLRPGLHTLERAIKLYGDGYTEAFENTPDHLLWADPKRNLFLRLELRNGDTIDTVTVSAYGPAEAPATQLPPAAAASGRGLRLGDSLDRAIALFGEPYFRGPSREGGRELLLVVHKFNVPEDQPQILETSYDPVTRRLLKITLSFPYY